MKKNLLTLILCFALALPAIAGATLGTTFEDFSVEVDQYTIGDGFNVGLSAFYADEDSAKRYLPIIEEEDVTPESLMAAHQALVDTNADLVPEGTIYLVAFCKDAEGQPLFKTGTYRSLSFNLLYEPYEHADGIWRAEMQLDADGFDPATDTVFIALYTFDPFADDPLLEKAVPAIEIHLQD